MTTQPDMDCIPLGFARGGVTPFLDLPAVVLVDMMGGTMGVDSKPGEGSTFWFTVACHEAEARPADRQGHVDEAEGPSDPMRILLAEDNVMNQVMIRLMLEAAGHVVQVVENGVQALHAVQSDPYDLVLMDVSMPEMDGVEATRHIRSLKGPESRIPIIALTANAMKGDREQYLAAGMTDYLSKPIHIEGLIRAIESQRVGRGPSDFQDNDTLAGWMPLVGAVRLAK